MQPVVAGHAVVAVERREQREPGRGPCTIATATAWFSVAIGLGADAGSSSVVEGQICGQSVSSASAASACTAAIAACSWYGPSGAVAGRR